MALEFASKHETFPHFKTFQMELAGRPLVVETGKMCGLSNGQLPGALRRDRRAVQRHHEREAPRRHRLLPLSVDFEESSIPWAASRQLHAP